MIFAESVSFPARRWRRTASLVSGRCSTLSPDCSQSQIQSTHVVVLSYNASLLRRSHRFTVSRLSPLRGPLLGPVLEQNADFVEQRLVELGFHRIRDVIDRLSPCCSLVGLIIMSQGAKPIAVQAPSLEDGATVDCGWTFSVVALALLGELHAIFLEMQSSPVVPTQSKRASAPLDLLGMC
jgi:hypothetical protein